jgi:ATP-dependent RNA helicase DeaD
MTSSFSQLGLHPELVRAVEERGYAAPMPIQAAMIPVMTSGQDVIGQAQTGSGKTAAFALPMLQNLDPSAASIQGLVLTPTRELALQVAGAIEDYGRFKHVRVLAVYGGAAYGPQIGELRRGVDIVVGTPGRIMDLMRKNVLDLSAVRTAVLDEADEMLSMGFIEDMETILSQTPTERQTALFSATMPQEIRQLADRYLRDPQSIRIQSKQMTVETTEQRYYLVRQKDKLAALARLFEMEQISSALIFARTRSGSSELANALNQRGFSAEVLNGDLSQDARERTLLRFRQNQVKVLVATDVAARGLDIDDISHVINYDLPDDVEVYVHRIGRTGRAGKSGIAISLLTPGEQRRLGQIESFTRQKLTRAALPTEEEIRLAREEKLLTQVKVWLERNRCQREREMVTQLVAEGHDALDIAAVALKMARGEEKQRPIAKVVEMDDRPQRPLRRSYDDAGLGEERAERSTTRPGKPRRFLRRSAGEREAGMTRLSLNRGKKHGMHPNDVVGAIAAHANIPGYVIGKIHIEERFTLVDVPDEFAARVLAKTGEVKIRKQAIEIATAR